MNVNTQQLNISEINDIEILENLAMDSCIMHIHDSSVYNVELNLTSLTSEQKVILLTNLVQWCSYNIKILNRLNELKNGNRIDR